MGDGVILVRGIAEDGDAAYMNLFRRNLRLEALKLEIPMDTKLTSDRDMHHDHELRILAYQVRFINRYSITENYRQLTTRQRALWQRTWSIAGRIKTYTGPRSASAHMAE
jgi:hypothetical protein